MNVPDDLADGSHFEDFLEHVAIHAEQILLG